MHIKRFYVLRCTSGTGTMCMGERRKRTEHAVYLVHLQVAFPVRTLCISKEKNWEFLNRMHELWLDDIKCMQCTRFRTSHAHLNGWKAYCIQGLLI